jgi:hypothetical protein
VRAEGLECEQVEFMTDSAAFGFAFASRFFIRFTPANRIIGLRSAGERGYRTRRSGDSLQRLYV